MRGCWLGLSSRHTRTDLLHDVLLASPAPHAKRLTLVAIQPAAAVGALRLAGGGTVSAPWRRWWPSWAPPRLRRPTRRSGTTVRSLISGAIAVLDGLADRWRRRREPRDGCQHMIAAVSDIMGQLSASEPVSQASEGSASVLDVVEFNYATQL
jgi:hypothetical protein